MTWPIRVDLDGLSYSLDLSGNLGDWEDFPAAEFGREGIKLVFRMPLAASINGILGRKYARLQLSGF